jgi:TetR/AcrR family transcriptional repressor of nem operon
MDAAQALVVSQGFSATTLDAILTHAGASKGAFFHHFASKDALGDAILERYAAADAEILDLYLAEAEDETDDPAQQIVSFVRLFEEAADGLATSVPGCLFVSFIYERGPDTVRGDDVIVGSIELWRARLLDKLTEAAKTRPELADVDLPALADQVFTIFEGGFILGRATGEPSHLRRQLAHLRRYLTLLLGVEETVT